MALDARFDVVEKILEHENADSLEIAVVSGFPCVVKKSEFKEGDWVFYVRDDAKLVGWDEMKERKARDEEAARSGGLVSQDCFHCSFPWQEGLLKFLGGNGRVKTVKLRGKISMGILVKPLEACPWLKKFDSETASFLNSLIQNKENGAEFLEKNFGVSHWTAPVSGGFGCLDVLHPGLEEGTPKSDEENWENLDKSELHLGSWCLVTKKLDGTSCTVVCRPDGTWSVASRSNTLKPDSDNVYVRHTKEAVKAGLWFAKRHGKTVVFQGEVCCPTVQKMGINKDKDLDDYFVYRCFFPEEQNWHDRMGHFGTDFHFLKIVEECNEAGFKLKHVQILGQEVVTEDLLRKWNDMPASWGEGVVLNVKVQDMDDMSGVWDYKSKSREYLMKIK